MWINKLTTIKMKSEGSVTINGKVFTGSNISVNKDTVVIDGEVVICTDKIVNIEIVGDCLTVENTSGDVNVKGNVARIETVSGNVEVEGDSHTVETVSGSVHISGKVEGDVSSVSGSIRSK